MAIFYGKDQHSAQSSSLYEDLIIEQNSNIEELIKALKIHQNGVTDYLTFCMQVAVAGVEKWVIDLEIMTVTYVDKAGREMIIEHIPEV